MKVTHVDTYSERDLTKNRNLKMIQMLEHPDMNGVILFGENRKNGLPFLIVPPDLVDMEGFTKALLELILQHQPVKPLKGGEEYE